MTIQPNRTENIAIANRSFGTRVLNGRQYKEAELAVQPNFKLIPIDREALLRANKKQQEFYIMQDPAHGRLIVFEARHDHLITDFIGIYAPASPDCIYPDADSPQLDYFFARPQGDNK
jgi:hypothetical protein